MGQNLMNMLEKVLGGGLALNGALKIDSLTVTTVDKARELGIVPQGMSQRGQGGMQQQGGQGQGQSSQSGQGQEGQSGQQSGTISREEFDNLMDEIRYMRSLMESGQEGQQTPATRGGRQIQNR